MNEAILRAYGTLLVGGLTLASVVAMVIALRPRRDVVAERLTSHAAASAEADLERPFWDRAAMPFIRGVLSLLGRVMPRGNVEEQRQLLLLAGNPGGLSVVDVLGVRFLLAALGLGWAVNTFFGSTDPGLRATVMLGAAPLLGYYLPTLWLRSRIKQRQQRIVRALPDVLDMLNICVESGLGLEAAMLRVGEQWDNVLTRELRRAVREMRMGISRAEALRHLAQRTEVPDLSTFVAVVVQAEQLGVSVATVLRTQSDQMRVMRGQRAEERAQAAPLKMVIALALLVMPSLFIVIFAPAIPRFAEMLRLLGS